MPTSSKAKLKAKIQKTCLTLLFTLFFALFSKIAFVDSPLSFPTEEHSIEIYSNDLGDDLNSLFEKAIKNSKKSVTLLTFSLSDPTLIYLLKQKSEEGVKVEVVLDHQNAFNLKKRLGKKVLFHPIKEAGLMHEKILIIDDYLLFLGSANATYSSLKFNSNLVIAFHAPSLIPTFLEEKERIISKKSSPNKNFHFIVDNHPLTLSFFPKEKGEETLLALLKTAEKTVNVAMYTFTHVSVANTLIDLKKKGVKVDVHLDHSQVKGASCKIYDQLRPKIGVFQNTDKALLHHKMVLIDGKTLLFGSANWTKAAFTRNRDYYMVIENLSEKETEKLNALFETLKRKNEKNE